MTENNVKWELSGSDNELGLARPLIQRLNKMTLLFIYETGQHPGKCFHWLKAINLLPFLYELSPSPEKNMPENSLELNFFTTMLQELHHTLQLQYYPRCLYTCRCKVYMEPAIAS